MRLKQRMSHLSPIQRVRNLKRQLRAEILERRDLMANDLGSLETGSIPREPADLLENDRQHYANLAASLGSGFEPTIALNDTFRLHSRPTATKTIYLDFDGFTARGTPWNTSRGRDPIISPAWDPDGNGAAFTNAELLRIQGIWQRVAADFSAFDVNVTTQEPPESDLVRTGSSDTRWGIRVVFTPDDFPAPNTGGIAYIGSFNWGYASAGATDTPTYVFNLGEVAAAGAASHEIGHTMGLSHDGTNGSHPTEPNEGYYTGHGTGENSWGPIMGVGGYYRNVTTWDNGVYFGSNNGGAGANYGDGPDDLEIITTENGFGYVPDAEANSQTNAALIESSIDFVTGQVNVSQFGVINRTGDVDYFRFQTGTGTVNLVFDPYINETFVNSGGTFVRTIEDSFFSTFWSSNQGANLDIRATLYDAEGNVVAVSDPDGLRARFTDLQLTSGIYYVSVEGVGFGTPENNPPTGYTNYASIGQYMITGTMPVALGLVLPTTPLVYTEGQSPVQVAETASIVDAIPGSYANGSLTVTVAPTPGSTDRLSFDPALGGLIGAGANIEDGGVVVATLVASSANRLQWSLSENATASSLEKLVRTVRFEATGDAPDPAARAVRFRIDKGTLSVVEQRQVTIVQVNDAPVLQGGNLPSIAEDSLPSSGQTIATIFANRFSDPDFGASMRGIAVANNPTPASEGRWQILTSPIGVWRDLPAVSPTARLALSSATRVRFIPAKDFFGAATPLQVHAVDNSYAGQFSTDQTLQYLSAGLGGPESPISLNTAGLGILVTPVNDAPRAQISELRFSVLQDEAIDAVIPPTAVIDIDDTELFYSATLAGGLPLPGWLSINPLTARFSGTPGSFDVNTYELVLRVSDPSGESTTLPVFIEVIDVNDPPTQLRFVGGTVLENSSGTRVGRLSAFDPDGDEVSWTSSDTRFVIRDGEVILVTPLNYENPEHRQISVTFTASDNNPSPLSSDLDVVITTLDVNEFYPQLVSKSLTVVDGTMAGTLVDVVNAPDGDTEQEVRYRLHSGDVSAFTLNPLTGELRLAVDVDLKQKNQYRVFIQAFDNGTPSFSTTAQFTILVEPANFFVPEFLPDQVLEFQENLAAGTVVGRAVVNDQDGNPLRYEILAVQGGEIGWLSINSRTGDIAVTASHRFDFEANRDHAVVVRVTEEIPNGNVVTATIPIQLLDVNDPPVGVLPLTIYPNRQGTAVTTEFEVVDQDGTALDYSFSTLDPRFEVRQGRLSLRPNQTLDSSLVGQSLFVPVRIVDLADNSSTNIMATVNVVAARAWQNPVNALDVNGDGRVTASDALAIINAFNADIGNRVLGAVRPFSALGVPEIDVTGDSLLTPADAVVVINALGQRAGGTGEGESAKPTEKGSTVKDLGEQDQQWLLAFNQLEEENLQRRRR